MRLVLLQARSAHHCEWAGKWVDKCRAGGVQVGQHAPQALAATAAALRNPDFLLQLLTAREGRCLSNLMAALAASGVHPSKEDAFDIWMKQQSDSVQVRPLAGARQLAVSHLADPHGNV